MTDHELSGQEASESVDERRANWERFTMTVLSGEGGGYVNVRNDSYDDATGHIHSVHVENGEADGCSCPHALYRGIHCKHQRAVEHCPLVLSSADAASAATTGQQVATDGGHPVEKPAGDDETPENTNESGAGDLPKITHHVESSEVGGQPYARCEGCGAEAVQDSYGETAILHEAGCPRANSAVDPYSDNEEVDDTPL